MRHAAVGLAMAGFTVLGACTSVEEPKVADNPLDPQSLDPRSEAHLYLEEVEGADALAWVRGENERTLKVLESDGRFQGYYDAALKIATSAERIPYGSIRNGYVYNLVLPILRSALDLPSSLAWTCTSNSSGEYVYTISQSSYPYANENDGKGKIVGQDWPDNIYEELVETTSCTVTLTAGEQVILTGSGSFYSRGDLYEYPLGIKMHDGWFSSQLDYTFTITIGVGANGTITATLDYTAQPIVTDQWENAFFKQIGRAHV